MTIGSLKNILSNRKLNCLRMVSDILNYNLRNIAITPSSSFIVNGYFPTSLSEPIIKISWQVDLD
jgi:hypothetical protein